MPAFPYDEENLSGHGMPQSSLTTASRTRNFKSHLDFCIAFGYKMNVSAAESRSPQSPLFAILGGRGECILREVIGHYALSERPAWPREKWK
jgi:hypothetical protein